MKITALVFTLAIATISFTSCKKSSDGGDAIVVAHIKHHDTPIKGATLYVKFKADELPSSPTTDYDLKITGEAAEDHIHIEGLRYGKYFLYAEGYDSTISQTVKGGVALKIKYIDRKKEIEADVPVTE